MQQQFLSKEQLQEEYTQWAFGERASMSPVAVMTFLKNLGETLCAYGGGEWYTRKCDCKFIDRYPDGRKMNSEMTGCSEVRLAIEKIAMMSGTEGARNNATLLSKITKARRELRAAVNNIDAILNTNDPIKQFHL